jgi:hypothetical protein
LGNLSNPSRKHTASIGEKSLAKSAAPCARAVPIDRAMRQAGDDVGHVVMGTRRMIDGVFATPRSAPLQRGNLIDQACIVDKPNRA